MSSSRKHQGRSEQAPSSQDGNIGENFGENISAPIAASMSTHVREAPPAIRPWHGQRLARIGSFSSLSRSQHHGHHHRPDHQEEDLPRDRDPSPIDSALDQGSNDLLAGLGKGAALGTQAYDILEQHLAEGRNLIECLPRRDNFESDENRSDLWLRAMQTIVSTPLTAAGLPALQDLRQRCIAEMHFLLPAADISPARLSTALLADSHIASLPSRRRWAESIAHWDTTSLEGFLQGYIDLIVEHDGKWFILDYKTNLLPNYHQETLEGAMLQANYVLQGRLYWLALHQHLTATLPGYAPETHLGGIIYLFVRGMPTQGIWFDQPDPAGLPDLSALTTETALTSIGATGGHQS